MDSKEVGMLGYAKSVYCCFLNPPVAKARAVSTLFYTCARKFRRHLIAMSFHLFFGALEYHAVFLRIWMLNTRGANLARSQSRPAHSPAYLCPLWNIKQSAVAAICCSKMTSKLLHDTCIWVEQVSNGSDSLEIPTVTFIYSIIVGSVCFHRGCRRNTGFADLFSFSPGLGWTSGILDSSNHHKK